MARVRGRGHSARVRALTRARRARVHRGCLSRRAKGISGSSHRKDVMRSQLRMAGPTARSKSAFGRPDWAERRRHRLLRGIGETEAKRGVEWHGVAWKRVVSGPVGLARLGLDCDLGPQVCPAMPRYPSYSLTYLSTCTCLLWLISQGAALSCHIYEVIYIRGDLYIVSMAPRPQADPSSPRAQPHRAPPRHRALPRAISPTPVGMNPPPDPC